MWFSRAIWSYIYLRTTSISASLNLVYAHLWVLWGKYDAAYCCSIWNCARLSVQRFECVSPEGWADELSDWIFYCRGAQPKTDRCLCLRLCYLLDENAPSTDIDLNTSQSHQPRIALDERSLCAGYTSTRCWWWRWWCCWCDNEYVRVAYMGLVINALRTIYSLLCL